MRYLSIDIEATGLGENDLIIEFAAIPFDSESGEIASNLSFHHYIACPPFETLKPNLAQWVVDHNETLIRKAHQDGLPIAAFKESFERYLTSDVVQSFFKHQKIVIFGKSLNAIDLPFLNRDLGWEFMRTHFSHRNADLTSICYGFIDLKILPAEAERGSYLMNYLGMGDVAHTALEDSINTAKMYLLMLKKR